MIAIARRRPMPLKPKAAEVVEKQHHTRKTNEKLPDQDHNPDTGRSSKLGRKAETPASIRSSGPSGQSGRTKHQAKHPNK
jgi:hypothetical protein